MEDEHNVSARTDRILQDGAMTEVANPFARENELTATDREAIVQAIKDAYPNRDFLYSRLKRSLGVDVADDVIALNNPGTVIVRAVVEHARANYKVLELLGTTWAEVRGNPQLRALAERWLIDPANVAEKFAPPAVGADPARPPLEKLVTTRSPLVKLSVFTSGLERLAGALCKIKAGRMNGTGFLIGRRTVLTNFHVVGDAIKGDWGGDAITCTFDYAEDDRPNVEVKAATEWKTLFSRYSDSDLTATGEPSEDELDFALVTLAHDVELDRDPLPWPATAPIVAQRDFLVIGQHPRGQTASIAFGEVVELPGSGMRYRYDVTTEGGSSGSPVLDLNLELVALHHAADPARVPRYNQGVPIARLMAYFKKQNLDMGAL